jgi:hypothetical protein
MSQSKSVRIRPKLKFLVKYKVFSSIRIFKADKLVKQKRSSRQASIKQRLLQTSSQRRRGWKLFRPRIVRNDIVALPKSPVSLSKRYKNLLTAKQRFKLSVFLKNSLLKKSISLYKKLASAKSNLVARRFLNFSTFSCA